MTMIEIVDTVLSNEGFTKEEGTFSLETQDLNYAFHKRSNLGVVLIDISDENMSVLASFLESYQMILFNYIKDNSLLYNVDLKKNIYLIFVAKKCDDESLTRKSVVEIEEDPFYFKKFVLQYTDEQLGFVSSMLSGVGNFRDKIVEVGSNNSFFQTFADETTGSINSIIYDILVKLPFIKINVDTREMHNLNSSIRNDLNAKQLLTLSSDIVEQSDSIVEMDDSDIDVWIRRRYEVQD